MEFTANLPLTSPGYKGAATPNGVPVNRSNSGYKTIGGVVDSADSENDDLVAYFGSVVSQDPAATEGNFALGKPSGYFPRGVLMFDAGIAQNDPAKSDYAIQDTPVTVIYEGTVQFSSWTHTQSGSRTAATIQIGDVPIFRALSTGSGSAPIGQVEFLPAGATESDVPTGWELFPGYIVEVTANAGVRLEVDFTTETVSLIPPTQFVGVATLTAAAAATPVSILDAADVPTGKKVYITSVVLKVNGATAWTDLTATVVKIQDTTAVAGLTYAKAGLVGNAIFSTLSGTSITTAAPISIGDGFTDGEGLEIVADAVFAAGSNIVVTVSGFIQ